jgi:hypothetical protein
MHNFYAMVVKKMELKVTVALLAPTGTRDTSPDYEFLK